MNRRTVGFIIASIGLLCLLNNAIAYLFDHSLFGGDDPPIAWMTIGIALTVIGAGLARQKASSLSRR